jgi:hypothetical protein
MAGSPINLAKRIRDLLGFDNGTPVVNVSDLPREDLIALGILSWGASGSQAGGAAGFAGFGIILPVNPPSLLSVVERIQVQSSIAGVLHLKPLASIPLDFSVVQPIVRRDARGSNLVTTGVQLPDALTTRHQSGTSAVNPIPLFTSALAWPLQAGVVYDLEVGYVLGGQAQSGAQALTAAFWIDTVNAVLTWNVRGYERKATLEEMQLR